MPDGIFVVSDTTGLSPGRNGRTPSFTCCSVRIDAHTLESAVDALMSRPDPHEGRAVHLCNAYTLSLARRDPELRHRLNQGNLNLPDGMPLIWVGRRLGLDHLEGRVYGPDLMLAAMDRGRELGLRHYLHGSTDTITWDSEWYHDPVQARDPLFVLTPKSLNPGLGWGASWDPWLSADLQNTLDLLSSTLRNFSIDTTRLYVTGTSMGGFGTFNVLSKRPGVFAAAYAVCGGGATTTAAQVRYTETHAFDTRGERNRPPNA